MRSGEGTWKGYSGDDPISRGGPSHRNRDLEAVRRENTRFQQTATDQVKEMLPRYQQALKSDKQQAVEYMLTHDYAHLKAQFDLEQGIRYTRWTSPELPGWTPIEQKSERSDSKKEAYSSQTDSRRNITQEQGDCSPDVINSLTDQFLIRGEAVPDRARRKRVIRPDVTEHQAASIRKELKSRLAKEEISTQQHFSARHALNAKIGEISFRNQKAKILDNSQGGI